jgi:hypothetical protein
MVRWSATVQGAALRNLFEDGVANPNDNTPAYIHSVRSAHLEHFGTILPRNFLNNYRRGATEYLTELAMRGARRAGAAAAPPAAPPARGVAAAAPPAHRRVAFPDGMYVDTYVHTS